MIAQVFFCLSCLAAVLANPCPQDANVNSPANSQQNANANKNANTNVNANVNSNYAANSNPQASVQNIGLINSIFGGTGHLRRPIFFRKSLSGSIPNRNAAAATNGNTNGNKNANANVNTNVNSNVAVNRNRQVSEQDMALINLIVGGTGLLRSPVFIRRSLPGSIANRNAAAVANGNANGNTNGNKNANANVNTNVNSNVAVNGNSQVSEQDIALINSILGGTGLLRSPIFFRRSLYEAIPNRNAAAAANGNKNDNGNKNVNVNVNANVNGNAVSNGNNQAVLAALGLGSGVGSAYAYDSADAYGLDD